MVRARAPRARATRPFTPRPMLIHTPHDDHDPLPAHPHDGSDAAATPPAHPDRLRELLGGGDHDGERGALTTRLTREYGIQLPFVGAGMGFVGLPALAGAVCHAGGLGVLGNGVEPPAGTRALIQALRVATAAPFGVDFLHDESAFGPLVTDAHLDVCVAERVPLVVFHMNVPPRAWVERLHAAGARVWMQCGSVEQAVQAVVAGVDAVVAQGAEAGGHKAGRTPLRALLPRVLDAVHPTLVLAAGGIADGEAAFRALLAGADGVWVGTRLVASTEAFAHAEYKARLVAAGAHAVATTTMFGPEYPGRSYGVLRNRIVEEFAGREDRIPVPPPPPAMIGKTVLFPLTARQSYVMPKFSAIVPTPDTVGDLEEMGLPAGAGVAAVRDVRPAAQIVHAMMADARGHAVRALTAAASGTAPTRAPAVR